MFLVERDVGDAADVEQGFRRQRMSFVEDNEMPAKAERLFSL